MTASGSGKTGMNRFGSPPSLKILLYNERILHQGLPTAQLAGSFFKIFSHRSAEQETPTDILKTRDIILLIIITRLLLLLLYKIQNCPSFVQLRFSILNFLLLKKEYVPVSNPRNNSK
jgi:hypothetical protein